MSAKVWISGILRNYDVGMKQGIRAKFYGHDWNPASFVLPLAPDEVHDAHRRYLRGHHLAPQEFAEAGAVWNSKQFKKVRDLLMVGPFYVVRGEIAKVLAEADLGSGNLVPCAIYSDDLKTPLDGQYHFLNFGAIKDTINIAECEDAKRLGVDAQTGRVIFNLNGIKKHGRVALNGNALDGADLWFEETVNRAFFVKDRLAVRIIEIGLGTVFDLQECDVIESNMATG